MHTILMVFQDSSFWIRREELSITICQDLFILFLVVPSDIKTGVYTLILTDGENEWIISNSFKVMIRKKLLAVWRDRPDDVGVRSRSEYRLEYQGSVLTAVVYRSCLMKDGQVTEEQSYDRYVKISVL